MNINVLESITKSIFNEVKDGVLMKIESYLDNEIVNCAITKNKEMYSNAVENHNRIIAFYDDDYIKCLIFEYLLNMVVEEEDLLVFGSYNDSSIKQVINAIIKKIEEIECPLFITSEYFEKQDKTLDYIASEYDNCIRGKYFAVLAFRDIHSDWVLEKGYLNELECKRKGKRYIEGYYFDEYMKSHINFLDLLRHRFIEVKRIEQQHIQNDYPHLI